MAQPTRIDFPNGRGASSIVVTATDGTAPLPTIAVVPRPPRRLPVALAVLLALAPAGCGSEDDDLADRRAEQAERAAVDAGLDDDVAAFLALVARGDAETWRAEYPGSDGTTLVVSNRPPERRVDVVRDGRVVEIRLLTGGEAHRCEPDDDGEPASCTRTDAFVAPPGIFDERAVERLTTALAGRLEDFVFDVEDDVVAGAEATCLVTTVRAGRDRPDLGGRGSLCVSDRGAVLRLDRDGEQLEASDYGTDVPADRFDLPGGPAT